MFTNYRYVTTETKVIALSTFAGKPVRGIAKCHPSDQFDTERGKRLAAARCNQKVAIKRFNRAQDKYDEALKQFKEAEAYLAKMKDYVRDSHDALKEATEELSAALI